MISDNTVTDKSCNVTDLWHHLSLLDDLPDHVGRDLPPAHLGLVANHLGGFSHKKFVF